jgi:hypothetical protein
VGIKFAAALVGTRENEHEKSPASLPGFHWFEYRAKT